MIFIHNPLKIYCQVKSAKKLIFLLFSKPIKFIKKRIVSIDY